MRSSSGPYLSQRPDSCHSSAGCTAGISSSSAPAAIHLLAHDVLDLAQHAQAQRHPGEQAGRKAPDQAGPQHQLVADDFGIGRDFLERGQPEFRKTHCGLILESVSRAF